MTAIFDTCPSLEPVGGFAGPVALDAPIGTFANVSVTRRQGAGSFAGDAGRQRQGSFSDSDRTLVVNYEDGAERSHVVGQADRGPVADELERVRRRVKLASSATATNVARRRDATRAAYRRTR